MMDKRALITLIILSILTGLAIGQGIELYQINNNIKELSNFGTPDKFDKESDNQFDDSALDDLDIMIGGC